MTPGLVCVRQADVWIFMGFMPLCVILSLLTGYALGLMFGRKR